MEDMRNTQRMLVGKYGGHIQFMGQMTQKKKAMKEETEFGGKLL